MHETHIETTPTRYPHRAHCTCGWTSPWGYLTVAAAEAVAQGHVDEAAMTLLDHHNS